jgi:hypothetical protein
LSLYAAEQYGSCPQAVMGLTYDWTTMNQLVTNISPAGNTNQAIGLELCWLSLVGGGPFTAPPMGSNYTYSQMIILPTDGLNTQNSWTSTRSSIDTRQQLTDPSKFFLLTSADQIVATFQSIGTKLSNPNVAR